MSIRRIVAAVLSLLVAGFVVFNFENWLEGHGWNDLFTDIEKSVTVMDPAFSPPEILNSINAFMISDFAVGFAIGALIFAFWDPVSRYSMNLVGRARTILPPTRTGGISASSPGIQLLSGDDHDVVPKGLRLKVKVGPDGADVTGLVTIRNRSLRPLRTEPAKPGALFEIDGRRPVKGMRGGGMNLMMPQQTNQTIRFGPVRILEAKAGVKGGLSFGVHFGQKENDVRSLFLVRYTFEINNYPSSQEEFLDCEIKEVVKYYGPKP